MKKVSKQTMIITFLLTAAPMLAGVILWNRLPERVPVHFGFDGQPDSWSSRSFAVFAMPAFLLAIHAACIKITSLDPKAENISAKVHSLVLWTVPAVSLFAACLTYGTALGYPVNANRFALVLMGVLFIAVGNYLPKCRQSYTVGIRIPWTLADEENWNRTHRMAGPLWIAGGLIFLISGFIKVDSGVIMFPVIILMVLVPCVYSYLLFRRKKAEN